MKGSKRLVQRVLEIIYFFNLGDIEDELMAFRICEENKSAVCEYDCGDSGLPR
jgi:hypothetical protein